MISRFKNILLYVNGGEANRFALDYAVELARGNEGRLTVARVVEELPREMQRLAAGMFSEDLENMARQEAHRGLEEFVAPVQGQGLEVEIEVFCGKPFLEISRAVQRRSHDLVMLTAEGRGGLGTRLLGSTSLHLMRKCPCPVWALKPSPQVRFTRILAAVDPDPLDVVRDGVNTKVLGLAASLARRTDSELHVAHAWAPEQAVFPRGWQTRVPEAQARQWVDQAAQARQRRFEELLGKVDLGKLKLRQHLVQGDAGSVIPALAGQEGIDLIVMGTVARTGIEGYLIGNTAETVLQQVGCSVLTVKPDGFVSPVKGG